jgi:hypothetical protein
MPARTNNGRELVCVGPPSAVMAVDVAPEGRVLALGTPHKLFDAPFGKAANAVTFDASADGNRFAVQLQRAQKPRRRAAHARDVGDQCPRGHPRGLAAR